ncbi:hypothetical protein ACQEV4_38525 [Streptomyces shenzhenensis]|uniref:hypothetical protein n=1 Tax=Streptomyces shenzhenensis TaxID=943815 RepID=UPI003D8E024F
MTRSSQVSSDDRYDVAVVGAGPAGLSTALMHGFLSRDGVPPGDLLTAGRREVAGYGGDVQAGRTLSAACDGDGFAIELDTGRTVRARRLLATAGVTDELPDVPGLAARWGRDVVHCPYCYGWEIRDQPTGVLATGPQGVQQPPAPRPCAPLGWAGCGRRSTAGASWLVAQFPAPLQGDDLLGHSAGRGGMRSSVGCGTVVADRAVPRAPSGR